MEAESREIAAILELEKEIEKERKMMTNMIESDELLRLQLLEIESLEESAEHSILKLQQAIADQPLTTQEISYLKD